MKTSVSSAAKISALMLGMAVPSVAFGRAVFAVSVGLAITGMLMSRPWQSIVNDLWAQIKTPVGLLVLLTFVAWLPNVFISDYPGRSFEAVFRTLIFVGLASAIFSFLILDRQLIDIALRAFVVMSAVAAIFTLLSMTVLPEIFWFMRLKGWLSKPIITSLKGFSSLAVVIIPILVLAGLRFSRLWAVTAGVLSIAYLAIVWGNYNRSAMAGLFAILVTVAVAYLIRKGTKKSVVISLGGISVIIAGLIVWLQVTRSHLQGYINKISPGEEWLFPVWLVDFERQTIWGHALEFASSSPWFGIGANTINFTKGADAIIPGTYSLHVIPAHPHSWVIEILSETGAVGLLVLLITILVLAWQTLLGWRRTGYVGLLVAIAVMAGYWGSGLFNFSYWSAWWQVSYLITLTFCFAFSKLHAYKLSGREALLQ